MFFILLITNMGCCPEPLTIYYKLNDLKISNCNLQEVLIDNSTVDKTKFRLLLSLNVKSFVKKAMPSLMINSAYATSCEDNHVGLNSDITNFTITCNKAIMGVEAGQPIDLEKMNIYKTWFYDDAKNTRMFINECLGILNNGGYLLAFNWFIEFREPLNSEEFLTFTVNIQQEDGNEFIAETNSVKVK